MTRPPLRISNVSDYIEFPTENYYYVDKTKYIETLEYYCDNNVLFLRPRRFGKSLFCSTLSYYYGVQYKKDFKKLFGHTYIYQHPTPKAHQYAILDFNFSNINTKTAKSTYLGFLNRVRAGIKVFLSNYGQAISKDEKAYILAETTPEFMLTELLTSYNEHPIFIIIDEYDQFANQLLAFDFQRFIASMGEDGFIRTFYEGIKIGREKYNVRRLFITGITPITLDAMTSGFNIMTNYTSSALLHDMMGLTEAEVLRLVKEVLKVPAAQVPLMMVDLKKWYDGYAFHKEASNRLYNTAMVMYFVKKHYENKKYPDELLDTSIASDYSKIKNFFEMGNQGTANYALLKQIIAQKTIHTSLTTQYSFQRPFTRADFLSLLYYVGFLTIDKGLGVGNILSFKIPNRVIEQLYLDYFLAWLAKREQFQIDIVGIQNQTTQMALEGNPIPFLRQVEQYLHHLSNRDFQNFSEKYVKLLMMCLNTLTKTFYVKSEIEHPNGYTDLLFLTQNPEQTTYQYVFELKYLKKKEAKKLVATQKEAKIQLENYLEARTWLSNLSNLQAYTVVVVKDKMYIEKLISTTTANPILAKSGN